SVSSCLLHLPYLLSSPPLIVLFTCSVARRYLHSFPTRRSSDLPRTRPPGGRRRSAGCWAAPRTPCPRAARPIRAGVRRAHPPVRSEEHTSELQSRFDLVCRLLLEKKKKIRARQTQRPTILNNTR